MGKLSKKEGKEEEQRREGGGKTGINVAKQMNQTSSGDKSLAEPNDFRQLHLECQIGF